MADVSSTASVIVALLAPYLSARASGAATQVLRKDRAWETASELWNRLLGQSGGKVVIFEALNDLEQHPDDDDARAAMRFQLRKVMDADPELTGDLTRLVESAASTQDRDIEVSGRTATINVSVGGDVIIGRSYDR